MPIDYQIECRVDVFTINRPDILNALSLDALRDFSEELADFQDNPELRAGIITGTGPKSFYSRMDLRSLWDSRRSPFSPKAASWGDSR
jgi:enoyl-CoA hydratase/carnithine racemase